MSVKSSLGCGISHPQWMPLEFILSPFGFRLLHRFQLEEKHYLHAVLHSWSEYYWENVQARENYFQQYLFHRCSLFTALLPSCLVKAESLLWLHRLQHTSVLPLNTQSFEPLSAGGGSMVTPWLCWDLGVSLAVAYCGLHRKLKQVWHRQLPL